MKFTFFLKLVVHLKQLMFNKLKTIGLKKTNYTSLKSKAS